jgi:hypothetical protein
VVLMGMAAPFYGMVPLLFLVSAPDVPVPAPVRPSVPPVPPPKKGVWDRWTVGMRDDEGLMRDG